MQLCYTNIGGTESFARCADPAAPYCARCTTVPPCESWCEAEVYTPLPLGSPCHLDRQCGGDPFAACHLGVCRRALWAGQRCDPQDPLSVCLYGLQRCTGGLCEGLGTNEACWDGYPAGLDLDCKPGWYCLRSVCVPQLPDGHTCYGEHPSECIRGHRCNLWSSRPRCTAELSLPIGVRASDRRLCTTAHADSRTGECAALPADDISGGDCRSSADCVRAEGYFGECKCKLWWQGLGTPGFCELSVAESQRPSYLEFFNLSVQHCHHDWSEERCAVEIQETELLTMVLRERSATADPTAPAPECTQSIIPVTVANSAQGLRLTSSVLLSLTTAFGAIAAGAVALDSLSVA